MSFDGAFSTIHLHRRRIFDRGLVVMSIVIDGVDTAKIRNGERRELRIRPGEHQIQVVARGLTPSQTIYFRVGPDEDVSFICQSIGHFIGRSNIDLQRDAPLTSASIDPRMQSHELHRESLRMEIVETDQFEERLGEEIRTIDNRDSATGVTRNIKASREWVHTMTVGVEQATTARAEIGGGLAWLTVKGAVERELHRTYSTESQTREVFEEQITITVPERTTVRLVLQWKRVWQRGVVRVTHSGGFVEVPFQTVVSLTFDQVQQDIDHAL